MLLKASFAATRESHSQTYMTNSNMDEFSSTSCHFSHSYDSPLFSRECSDEGKDEALGWTCSSTLFQEQNLHPAMALSIKIIGKNTPLIMPQSTIPLSSPIDLSKCLLLSAVLTFYLHAKPFHLSWKDTPTTPWDFYIPQSFTSFPAALHMALCSFCFAISSLYSSIASMILSACAAQE